MVKLQLFLAVVAVALTIYAVVDVLGRPDHQVPGMPRLGWVVLILVFPLVAPIAWIVVSRQSRGTNRY